MLRNLWLGALLLVVQPTWASENCPPPAQIGPGTLVSKPWCNVPTPPPEDEAQKGVITSKSARTPTVHVCRLQLVGPNERAIRWNREIVHYTDSLGSLDALNNPETGNGHVRLLPWQKGERVEYTVKSEFRTQYGYSGGVQRTGSSENGEIVVRPGEQFWIQADSLVQTVDGYVSTGSQSAVVGDARLDKLTGDPDRLDLAAPVQRAYLLAPYTVIGRGSFSVHIAFPYGPPVPPSVRIAVAVQQRLHPRAYSFANRWECGFDEVQEGDEILIWGGPRASTEYFVSAIAYLPIEAGSNQVVISPLNNNGVTIIRHSGPRIPR